MSQRDRDKQDRRRRARETIGAFLVRVRRICDRVGDIDSILDEIAPIAQQIKEFAEGPRGKELIPDRERRFLLDAAKQFERARDRIDTLADVCNLLQEALQAADEAVLGELAEPDELGEPAESAGNGGGAAKWLWMTLGGIVVGGIVVVAAAALLLVSWSSEGGQDDWDDSSPPDPDNCYEECFEDCLADSSDPEFPDREGCTMQCEEECPSAGGILPDRFLTADVQEGLRTFLSRQPLPTLYALQD